MKEQPTPTKTPKAGFDESEFLARAKTTLSDRPTGNVGRKSMKHPALGYKRVTFDIEMSLHEALDEEAFRTKRKRREIVEDLLREHFTSKNQQHV